MTEGKDFYLEYGRMVFTEKFLQERGYCCNSGCRHCPYTSVTSLDGSKEEKSSKGEIKNNKTIRPQR